MREGGLLLDFAGVDFTMAEESGATQESVENYTNGKYSRFSLKYTGVKWPAK
jgi:hypothetical protein